MHTARPAVRWVKVAWLGSLLSYKGSSGVREAAARALSAVDNDDAEGLRQALLDIAHARGVITATSDLAKDAAATVGRAMSESVAGEG